MITLEQPFKLDVWVLNTQSVDPHVRLLEALEAACAVHAPFSVTSENVREHLPDANRFWPKSAEWDLRSVGQVLSTLADRRQIFRVGVYGNPAVQHWIVDPRGPS